MATVRSWCTHAGNQASPCASAFRIHFWQTGPPGDPRTHEREGLEGDAPSAEGSRFADGDGRTSASLRPKAMPGQAVAWRSRPGSATSGFGLACEIQRRHRLLRKSHCPGRHRTKEQARCIGPVPCCELLGPRFRVSKSRMTIPKAAMGRTPG